MLSGYARAQYEELQVQTTPGKLVVMLYDGVLRYLHLALDALRRGDREAQSASFNRAQNILFELANTLDMGAGAISRNLMAIYDYCQYRLLLANAEEDPASVEEVIRLLTPLREAWEQAERQARAQEVSAGPSLLPGPER